MAGYICANCGDLSFRRVSRFSAEGARRGDSCVNSLDQQEFGGRAKDKVDGFVWLRVNSIKICWCPFNYILFCFLSVHSVQLKGTSSIFFQPSLCIPFSDYSSRKESNSTYRFLGPHPLRCLCSLHSHSFLIRLIPTVHKNDWKTFKIYLFIKSVKLVLMIPLRKWLSNWCFAY